MNAFVVPCPDDARFAAVSMVDQRRTDRHATFIITLLRLRIRDVHSHLVYVEDFRGGHEVLR